MPSFDRGDHIRVWRGVGYLGYHHHGIYVSDERVIQFGGRVSDKRRATIEAVSLTQFESGGRTGVVQHGGRTWWGAPRFEAIPKEQAVERAEWLLANHPKGLYNLFGYNCEQAATFCATNSYESYQVRGFFAVRLLFGWPIQLFVALRYREKRPLSRVATAALYAWFLSGLVAHFLYYARGERFMREVGRKWSAHERERRRSEGE